MGRRRKIRKRLRCVSLYNLHLIGPPFPLIFLNKSNSFRISLHSIDPDGAVLKRSLYRHASGSCPDVIKNRIFLKLQGGNRHGPDCRLGHRHFSPDQLFIFQMPSHKRVVVRIVHPEYGEPGKQLRRQLPDRSAKENFFLIRKIPSCCGFQMIQPVPGHLFQKLLCCLFAAKKQEGVFVGTDLINRILSGSVKAYQCRLLPRHLTACRHADH